MTSGNCFRFGKPADHTPGGGCAGILMPPRQVWRRLSTPVLGVADSVGFGVYRVYLGLVPGTYSARKAPTQTDAFDCLGAAPRQAESSVCSCKPQALNRWVCPTNSTHAGVALA